MTRDWTHIIQNQTPRASFAHDQNCLFPLNTLGLISISGVNATAFLQGQVTCDMNGVTSTQASMGGVCDAKGRLQANFLVFPYDEKFYFLLANSLVPAMLKHLNKYAVFSKVKIADETESWWFSGIYHPIPETNHFTLRTQKNLVVLQLTPQRQFILSGNSEVTRAWWQAHKTTPVADENAWMLENIQNGIATIEIQTKGLFTPQMINLEKWNGISFKKGCYIGQEIVARTQHLGKLKRHLYQIQFTSSDPILSGENILTAQNENVGVLVNAAVIQPQHYQALAVIEDRLINQDLFLRGQRINITV